MPSESLLRYKHYSNQAESFSMRMRAHTHTPPDIGNNFIEKRVS
jgi:hypothetical protein